MSIIHRGDELPIGSSVAAAATGIDVMSIDSLLCPSINMEEAATSATGIDVMSIDSLLCPSNDVMSIDSLLCHPSVYPDQAVFSSFGCLQPVEVPEVVASASVTRIPEQHLASFSAAIEVQVIGMGSTAANATMGEREQETVQQLLLMSSATPAVVTASAHNARIARDRRRILNNATRPDMARVALCNCIGSVLSRTICPEKTAKGKMLLIIHNVPVESKMKMVDMFFNLHFLHLAKEEFRETLMEEKEVYMKDLELKLKSKATHDHPRRENIIKSVNKIFGECGLSDGGKYSHIMTAKTWVVDLKVLFIRQVLETGKPLPPKRLPRCMRSSSQQ